MLSPLQQTVPRTKCSVHRTPYSALPTDHHFGRIANGYPITCIQGSPTGLLPSNRFVSLSTFCQVGLTITTSSLAIFLIIYCMRLRPPLPHPESPAYPHSCTSNPLHSAFRNRGQVPPPRPVSVASMSSQSFPGVPI